VVSVSAVAGLALLTGCGGGQPATSAPIAPAAAVQQQQKVSVNAAEVAGLGNVLTDQGGKTLYLFTKDSTNPPKSTCVDKCADAWPPLMATSDADVLVTGIDRELVGTVARPDGNLQVTVNNWPVYMYSGDTGPGQANGQGLQDAWYAITQEGKKAGEPAEVGVVSTDIPGFGNALTDQGGRTLYLFTKDSTKPAKSNCDGECAEQWPPLLATGDVAITGVDPELVGTVTRSDGTEQVTVGNWPVYTFAKDTAPGQTKGHGVNGVWFVIEEEGCKSTAPVTDDEAPPADEEEDNTGY
jgi:predicted lipoprotein with Yx(FWY)xxD motif